jgi:AraC-like DNA-binding protein
MNVTQELSDLTSAAIRHELSNQRLGRELKALASRLLTTTSMVEATKMELAETGSLKGVRLDWMLDRLGYCRSHYGRRMTAEGSNFSECLDRERMRRIEALISRYNGVPLRHVAAAAGLSESALHAAVLRLYGMTLTGLKKKLSSS